MPKERGLHETGKQRSQREAERTAITCPSCGAPSRASTAPRALSRACSDPRCEFRFGYRLDPIATEDKQGAKRIMAVPLTTEGERQPDKAVVWPRGSLDKTLDETASDLEQ